MPIARAVVAMLMVMVIPAAAGSSPSPSFTSWLATQMPESKIPGVSIAVIKDYRVEWAAGFGMSDIARQVKVTPPYAVSSSVRQQANHSDCDDDSA